MPQEIEHQSEIRLQAYLRELLAGTLPGERWPGIREMMKSSGSGRIRLERQLEILAGRKQIEIRPQSGIYRLSDDNCAVVAFIHFSPAPIVENSTNFISDALKNLRIHAQNAGLTLEIVNAGAWTLKRLEHFLRYRKFSQAFICADNFLQRTELIKKYVEFTVSLLPRHSASAGSELRDSPEMTSIQLQYLLTHNYRKIAFIHNVEKDWSQTPVQMHRLLEYYRIMAEHGLQVEPEWVFYCGYNWEHFNHRMYKLMKCHRLPDAIIASGGGTLSNLYTFCANNGIAIGRELAVMSCDDTAPELTPTPTTVTNNPGAIGESAWQIMQRTIAGEEVRAFTELQIQIGQSVLRGPEKSADF